MLAADEELISHDRPGRGTPEPNLYSLLANPPETASIVPSVFLKSAAFSSAHPSSEITMVLDIKEREGRKGGADWEEEGTERERCGVGVGW